MIRVAGIWFNNVETFNRFVARLQLQDPPPTEESAMSWSISYTSREEFERDAPKYQQDFGDASDEVKEQIATARDAASRIIASGVVGRDADVPGGHKDYAVSISGHANPGHEPARGYANDAVYISISQKETPALLGAADRAANPIERAKDKRSLDPDEALGDAFVEGTLPEEDRRTS